MTFRNANGHTIWRRIMEQSMQSKSNMTDRSPKSAANVILGNDMRYSPLRSLLTLMLAIMGLVYLSYATLGATLGLGVSAQKKKQDTVASPLELRLILPAAEVCLNSKNITLEVEMKNIGKQSITI